MAQVLPNLQQENEALKAQLAALMAKVNERKTVSFKVSDKGAVSCYGLGRFPVTLYLSQWEALFANTDKAKAFIAANRAVLKVKE